MRNSGNITTMTAGGLYKAAASCLAVVFLILTSACERRPLDDPDSGTRIQIALTVKSVLNVNSSIYNEKIPVPDLKPEVMHVLFYDVDTDELLTETFISEVGENDKGEYTVSGNIRIGPGTYRMLTYNFGTEATMIKDYWSWSGITAHTNSVEENIIKSYKSKAPAEIITYMPDHLIVARNEAETIPYHDGNHVIHAEASTIIDTYYLQIKVEGLQYVASAKAFLSGMSGGNVLSRNYRITDPENTVYMELLKSDDNGTDVLCNIFNTFGHIDKSVNNLEITFDLRTVDGRTEQRTFDVSDLFYTEDAIERHWLLLNETIIIDPPPNPEPGGGMDPTVNDWENEYYDLNI